MTATIDRPAPVFVGDFAPGSAAWHAARANGLGGSEIAAVLGLSPWESRFSLWHRKKQLADPVAVTDVMYWGTRLEGVIRDEWNKRHQPDGWDAYEGKTWSHYRYPWMIANPDGQVFGDDRQRPSSLLEVKTARDADGWGEPGTDEIPIYYRTQCLWYLDVFGLDLCHVAVLIAGSDYREYQVTYDADEAEFMRGRAREFLDTIERDQRPDIDAHSATFQVIRELHPDIDDVAYEVPRSIAVPYLDAIEVHRAAAEDKQRTAGVLLDAMGTARRAYFNGDQIAMRIAAAGEAPPYLRHTPTRPTTERVILA